MGIKIVRTKTTRQQFSKKVIAAMTVLWFLTAVFGGVVVWVNGYGLEALLSFVGAPMAGGIVGYMVKSAMENKEKIRNAAEIVWEEESSPQIGFCDSEKGEDHP